MRNVLLLGLAGCVPPATRPAPGPTPEVAALGVAVAPPTGARVITVDADGAPTPRALEVRPGDVVAWRFVDPRGAVVPVDPDAEDPCAAVAPATDGGLAGPALVAPGGLVARDGAREATWSHPAVAGVALDLAWRDVEPAPGVYDWSALDAAAARAVAHGRWLQLGLVAGGDGTPAWLAEVGAALVPLTDRRPGDEGCGDEVALGNPADPVYLARWLALLDAVADHLRARADTWRALAAVTVGGTNRWTPELALPRACDADCPCAPEVWAAHGYDADALLAFHEAQLDALAAAFPGKATVLAAVGGAFPEVDASAAAQTGAIVAAAVERSPWLVLRDDHLGGDGAPARRVVRAGRDGVLTALRTGPEVSSPGALRAALRGAWDGSDAGSVEVPERLLGSDPDLVDWSRALADRRAAQVADPAAAPSLHAWVVDAAPGAVVGFADPAACATGGWGTLTVR